MDTGWIEQRISHANQTNAVFVRGATAPPRPSRTVTVAPGLTATIGFERRRAPLYVTAQATTGRTVREYDGPNAHEAAECAETLARERDADAVWLCNHEQVVSWWGERVADGLERRLAEVARETDATLVVWSAESDGAVDDRYDVVLDP